VIRVCLDVRSVPPGAMDGTGVYAGELIHHLRGSVELSVLSPRPRAELGVPAVPAPDGAQIFHRPSQFFDRAALAPWLRAPLPVITYLDLISYRMPALFRSEALHRDYCALSWASLHAAQAVIAISQHARREIIGEFELPEERVHHIPLGVDAAFFAKPAERRIPERYFLCSGSDYPHKNLRPLLQGYAWLRASWKEAGPVPELVLTGSSSGAAGGVFQFGPAPAPGVRYLGVVPRDELPALYQHALAFVYPSSYEGFGLPILEAMAAGAPVLCSRLTSLPEVAGDAALYLDDFSLDDFAQKLRALANDSALGQRLIEAGRRRALQFRWEDTARRTAELYEEVIAHPAPAATLRRQMLAELVP
jgi:glycosyltransferase involved in cell wall biosynthesis